MGHTPHQPAPSPAAGPSMHRKGNRRERSGSLQRPVPAGGVQGAAERGAWSVSCGGRQGLHSPRSAVRGQAASDLCGRGQPHQPLRSGLGEQGGRSGYTGSGTAVAGERFAWGGMETELLLNAIHERFHTLTHNLTLGSATFFAACLRRCEAQLQCWSSRSRGSD